MSKLGSRLGPRLGPAGRSILEAGRAGDDPTPADRARVKRALMRSIAAGAALGAASQATSAAARGASAKGSLAVVEAAKATSTGLGIKLLGGALLALAVGAGVLLERASRPDPASTKADTVAEAPAAADSVTAAPATVNGDSVAPAKAVAVDPRERLREAVPREKASVPTPSARSSAPVKTPASEAIEVPEEDPLAAEIRRLREAHGALQGGEPQRALTLLDEQGGQLGEERAAARVLALCQMGRAAEAEAARAAFLRDHPRSPLADRIRGGCAPSTAR